MCRMLHVTRHTSPPQVCTYIGHRSHVLCCSFHYWLYTGSYDGTYPLIL